MKKFKVANKRFKSNVSNNNNDLMEIDTANAQNMSNKSIPLTLKKELITDFTIALKSKNNHIVKKMLEVSAALVGWFKGKPINLIDDDEHSLGIQTIATAELIDIFRIAVMYQFSYVIRKIWEDNALLQDYYFSKEINFNPPGTANRRMIDFATLCKDFIFLFLHGALDDIYDAIWEHNPKLKKWFIGEQVTTENGKLEASDTELINHFNLALTSLHGKFFSPIWQQERLKTYIEKNYNSDENEIESIALLVRILPIKGTMRDEYLQLVNNKNVIEKCLTQITDKVENSNKKAHIKQKKLLEEKLEQLKKDNKKQKDAPQLSTRNKDLGTNRHKFKQLLLEKRSKELITNKTLPPLSLNTHSVHLPQPKQGNIFFNEEEGENDREVTQNVVKNTKEAMPTETNAETELAIVPETLQQNTMTTECHVPTAENAIISTPDDLPRCSTPILTGDNEPCSAADIFEANHQDQNLLHIISVAQQEVGHESTTWEFFQEIRKNYDSQEDINILFDSYNNFVVQTMAIEKDLYELIIKQSLDKILLTQDDTTNNNTGKHSPSLSPNIITTTAATSITTSTTIQSLPSPSSTPERINKTKTCFETELKDFQTLISSRCNPSKIATTWNKNRHLQAYYCSKKINFGDDECSIDFQTLKRDFLYIFPQRISKIRSAIWNNNTKLQQWFVGESIVFRNGLSPVKASISELIENFQLALEIEQIGVARKIWEKNKESRITLVNQNGNTKSAAELLRKIVYSKLDPFLIHSYIKLVTSKNVILDTLKSTGKKDLPKEYEEALNQRSTELDAPQNSSTNSNDVRSSTMFGFNYGVDAVPFRTANSEDHLQNLEEDVRFRQTS